MTVSNSADWELLKHLKTVYLLGIGGIGMSSLARFFMEIGHCKVFGYDHSPSKITQKLVQDGAVVHYDQTIPQSILHDTVIG